ncbi:hypothetical protein HOY34_08600 [Xinfangfangia sp. D13-10-4-6]|uniref:hypothetical protein n=1 Tax=Pseudogemmobacter hezensis TaxID=2737662 RepID=UPI00155228C8|nr:hypothetical protein [Pseudogemmobacter hezensis]NPD15257.1 hypothetical protein [Pseudogemmobacter hezensis]
MENEFLRRLLTPSPIMHWLLILFPVVVAIAGLTGVRRRHGGAVRLTILAVIAVIWMTMPVHFADPVMQSISVIASVTLWFSVLVAWARHVWNRWPSPVWAHAWVVSHLVTILIASVVALVRALG